jgi:O-antigen/teichoic acid export membrane protein
MVSGKQAEGTGGAGSEVIPAGYLTKLRADALNYFPAAVIPALASIVGVAVFTRIFTSEEYGWYTLVAASAVISTTLASGWIQQSVLRYLPRFKAEGNLDDFMSKFMGLILVVSALVVLLASVFYYPLEGRMGVYAHFYFPGLALVVSGLVFLSINSVFQADLRSGSFALHRIAMSVLRLLIALALVFFVKRDVVGIILGAAAAYFLLIIPMALKLRGAGRRPVFGGFDLGFVKATASYGFPIIGWMMAGQILSFCDKFMLAFFKDASQVGIYAANYNLVNMGVSLLSGPIIMAAHPLVMNVWESGERSRVPSVIREFSRYYILIVVPAAVFVGVFNRELVRLLLGWEFRAGARIIPVVLAGFFAWGFSMYGHKGLELMEKTRMMLLLVAGAVVMNLLLNWFLIPPYGYMGAAIATTVSYMSYPVLIFFVSGRYLEWLIPWRSLLAASVSSLPVGLLCFFAAKTLSSRVDSIWILLGTAVLAIPLYLVLLSLAGEVRESDRRLMR